MVFTVLLPDVDFVCQPCERRVAFSAFTIACRFIFIARSTLGLWWTAKTLSAASSAVLPIEEKSSSVAEGELSCASVTRFEPEANCCLPRASCYALMLRCFAPKVQC